MKTKKVKHLHYATPDVTTLVSRYGSPRERLQALASLGIDELMRRGMSFKAALDHVRSINQALAGSKEEGGATTLHEICRAARN